MRRDALLYAAEPCKRNRVSRMSNVIVEGKMETKIPISVQASYNGVIVNRRTKDGEKKHKHTSATSWAGRKKIKRR